MKFDTFQLLMLNCKESGFASQQPIITCYLSILKELDMSSMIKASGNEEIISLCQNIKPTDTSTCEKKRFDG